MDRSKLIQIAIAIMPLILISVGMYLLHSAGAACIILGGLLYVDIYLMKT